MLYSKSLNFIHLAKTIILYPQNNSSPFFCPSITQVNHYWFLDLFVWLFATSYRNQVFVPSVMDSISPVSSRSMSYCKWEISSFFKAEYSIVNNYILFIYNFVNGGRDCDIYIHLEYFLWIVSIFDYCNNVKMKLEGVSLFESLIFDSLWPYILI